MRWIGCVVILLAMAIGCESKPKDPYEEWFASQNYRDFVPPEAQAVAEGTGVLTYRSPEAGRVYVVDHDDLTEVKTFKKPRVVVVCQVDPQIDVRFDPEARQLLVTGQQPIGLTKVTAGHRHEMRFVSNEVKE
jgi:hypothetical protein